MYWNAEPMSRELDILRRELIGTRNVTTMRKDFYNYGNDLNKITQTFITDVKKQAEKKKMNKVSLLAIIRD